MASSRKNVLQPSSQVDVNRFLQQVRSTALPAKRDGRARLIFGMDATASREPLWDRACHIQAQMFEATASMGGIEIQLAYYRGFGEFKAAPWAAEADVLQKRMTSIRCAAGQTQIRRLLKHALEQARSKQGAVSALVFVGDCMEEDPDSLAQLAGELGILSVPVFLFQDGADPIAAKTFSTLARLTRGAHCRFDGNSAAQLRDLLCAVAVYAAGGRKALADHGKQRGGEVLRLIAQLDSRG